MQFDFMPLRGKIVGAFGTIEAFADRMGLTPTTLGRKLSNKSRWTQLEMYEACRLLKIPENEVTDYFFTAKS